MDNYNNNTLLHNETHNLLPQRKMSDEEVFAELCRRYFRCKPRDLRKFLEGLPHYADSLDCLPTVKRCLPAIERFPEECKTMSSKVDKCMHIFDETMCAAQYLYGPVTITHHSQDLYISLDQVVQGLGGDYVDGYPIPAGKRARVRQKPRPGYRPLFLRGDFNLNDDALAYSDLSLQFFIGAQNIGQPFSGDTLLQKSGNQLKLDFPSFHGNQMIVGSNELLEIEIINNSVHTLNSAHIRIHHDSKLWFEQCATTTC